MDLLRKNVQTILHKLDGDALEVKGGEFQHRVSGSFQVYLTIRLSIEKFLDRSFLYTRG